MDYHKHSFNTFIDWLVGITMLPKLMTASALFTFFDRLAVRGASTRVPFMIQKNACGEA